MAKPPPAEAIAAFIDKANPRFQAPLRHLRQLIVETAPEADEALIYGVPGFRYKGKGLVCYAAFKAHCGFYPMSPALMDRMEAKLEGFRVAQGTIHFTPDQPLPDALVTEIVRARLAEIDAS